MLKFTLKFVLAPNSFRDCLSSSEVAQAMKEGLQEAAPGAEFAVIPMADGGDGMLSVLQQGLETETRSVEVRNAVGRDIEAKFLISSDGQTAFIEMAEASGLRRVSAQERDAWRSSTYGTGELIRHALDAGARRIVVGAGGSATLEAGAGALAALGARFYDAQGRALSPTPEGLSALERVDVSHMDPRLLQIELILLSDVDIDLGRNARFFGSQKGIRSEDFPLYENVLHRLADCAALKGYDLLGTPWSGAGGGIAAGLSAFAGGKVRRGAETIARTLDLSGHIKGASLVLTGEGRLDESSLHGKVPYVVSQMASTHGVPCAILAGQIAQGLDQRFLGNSLIPLAPEMSLDESLAQARQNIVKICRRLGKTYANGHGTH